MFKIITLAVVLLTVVLLHGSHGSPVGRRAADDGTTRKPKLIRVHLSRSGPARTVDLDDGDGRSKREVPEDLEFFGGHRSPVMKPVVPGEEARRAEAEPTEDFFRYEPKGFETRELERAMAEAEVVDDGTDATDGRALTDDENQRFDVETTSSKMNQLDEIDAFFDRRHQCNI